MVVRVNGRDGLRVFEITDADADLKAKHDITHGSPFDRGSADFYYWKGPQPHYRPADSPQVNEESMSPEQVEAYYAGYAYGEAVGERKDYN